MNKSKKDKEGNNIRFLELYLGVILNLLNTNWCDKNVNKMLSKNKLINKVD